MKEKELIDLGFTKVEVPEDGGEDKFYYFTYNLGNISLVSTSDIESVDKGYDNAHFGVEIFELEDEFLFTESSELQILIDVLKRNTTY